MIITCNVCPCDVPMVLKERLPNYKRNGQSYRRRRFECPVCGFKKMVIGDGETDEKAIPERGITIVKAIAKKETENREY